MSFKNILREYFTFNRRERNGVFVLLGIILLLILYLACGDLFFTREKTDFSQFEKEISEFEAAQNRTSDSLAEHKLIFSGNTLIEEHREREKPVKVSIELNSADSLTLLSVKGIGPAFAHRILTFRNALGGFVFVEQLGEVYGMDQEKLHGILPQVSLDAAAAKKLNVNTASVEDLNLHPYISKKEAVAIFNKRVKTGDFTDISGIKKVALMSDSAFAKIEPYLILK